MGVAVLNDKAFLAPLVLLAALTATSSCTQSDFAGGAERGAARSTTDGEDADSNSEDQEGRGQDGKDGEDGEDGKDADGDGNDDEDDSDSDSDGDGADDELGSSDDAGGSDEDLDTEDETIHAPESCTTATIKFAPAGGAKCPAHYAAYTADDSKSYVIGCCPLPARDILGKNDPVLRGQKCNVDEVATGADASGLYCTKINTKRYKLGTVQQSCYVGDGASGGQSATPCGAPSATLSAMVASFGSDACIGSPYGSLIVARTSKYCRDVYGSQLFYKDDDSPVKMFK